MSNGVDLSITRDAIPSGYESISVSSTAIGITSSLLSGAKRPVSALLTVETGSIRWTVDGTTPTSTGAASPTPADAGHLTLAGDSFTIEGTNNLNRLRMIAATATAVTVKVTLFF